MKTKNILKAMALAMLLPATMLTTACSSDDNIVNNEPTIKKGYQLPVTVNVTRQGDATTRASYNESTKKLSFSTGDQLFVEGYETTAGCFAGALTWTSGGTFSGTIITENEYTGTFNDLFTAASAGDYNYIRATLLPAGYENYGFLYIEGSESEAYVDYSEAKAFAATKALAVEQFSAERTDSYDNGFALEPAFAILNFTITGLSASTEVAVALQYNVGTISGSVTTDGSGTATFAMAVTGETLTQWISSLTVDGNAITIGSGTTLAAGHIYNISRIAWKEVAISNGYTAQTGDVLVGSLNGGTVSIADGATVMLGGMSITFGDWNDEVGIKCLGDATIILKDGTTNTLSHTYLQAGPSGKTLTIQGTTGVLNVTYTDSGLTAAAIGAANDTHCGDINIEGGIINASAYNGAGIGGAYKGNCGNITISGGTVTATAGQDGMAAGIGSGSDASCGTITITSGVTKVTATMADGAKESIGRGEGTGSCGTVTIGGTVYWDGSAYQNGGDTYLTQSPLTYQP